VQTPWGDLEVRDAHVHFFSRNFLTLLTGGHPPEQTAATLRWDCPPEDPAELARTWLDEMDRHGLDSVSLISSIPGDEDSVAAALRLAPSRFHGCFLLNPLSPDAPRRAAHAFHLGLKTLCLFPAMHAFSVSDSRLEPLWSIVREAPGRNVFVHCGVLSIGVRQKLGLPSPFDMRFSNPLELHPVALRMPHVRFQIPHFGAGMFREALMLASLCPNVYLDTSSSNSWMRFSESPLDLKAVFARSLDVLGPNRLLFGTDSSFFPRGWVRPVFDTQCAALRLAGVSTEDAARILGGNLLDFNA
jgi:uncharacterized protein